MSTSPNTPTHLGPRRRLLVIAAVLPAVTWATLGGGSAWAAMSASPATARTTVAAPTAAVPSRSAGLCTPRHLSGCDGTDYPIPGDGRTLRYCRADGICTRVPGPQGGEQSYYTGIPTSAPAAQHSPKH